MVKTKSLLRKLAVRFPKRIARKYRDPIGLQVGKLKENVQKIVVCLDFDHVIADQVFALNPDLIITHHPFIYGTRAKVLARDSKKAALVLDVEARGLAIYSFHTNFDEGAGGMNDALAARLNLTDIVSIEAEPMMRGGTLPYPMSAEQFSQYAREKLNVPFGLLINAGKKEITNVAIIGGGGSREYTAARDAGYDLYISGDAPHHVRRAIINDQYNYLDLPHEIERIFMETMKKHLLVIDPSLEIITLDQSSFPQVIKAPGDNQ